MRITTDEMNNQNFVFFVGENFVDFDFVLVRTVSIKIEAASANTPPSFDGIDRRIT